jgi:glyoxylase-like metal-dependent hydrolase (beta-lactamase superfamily II)
VRPTDEAQFAAFSRSDLPAVDEPRIGIWSIPIPIPRANPAFSGPPYTLCYAIEDSSGSVHLIDPGMHATWLANGDALEHLRAGLRMSGHSITDVTSVILTHGHLDHGGAAADVKRESGALIVMSSTESKLFRQEGAEWISALPARLDEWGVPVSERSRFHIENTGQRPARVPPGDVLVDDLDTLQIPGRSITVMSTPGHSAGHINLVSPDDNLVFTGDHLLPTINPGIGLGGDTAAAVASYLHALNRTSALSQFEAAPGHEFRFTELADRAGQIASHHLRRSRQTESLLRGADPTLSVWSVASRLLWARGFEGLRGFILFSALAQTRMHMDFVLSNEGRRVLADGWPKGLCDDDSQHNQASARRRQQ